MAQAAAAALIADAITGAQDSLVVTEVRNGPAQPQRRRKVVPIILVQLFVRLRRVLSHKLRLYCNGAVQYGGTATDWSRRETVTFIRHSIVLVPQPRTQAEIRADEPIVFKECAPFVLADVPILLVKVAVIFEGNILRIGLSVVLYRLASLTRIWYRTRP